MEEFDDHWVSLHIVRKPKSEKEVDAYVGRGSKKPSQRLPLSEASSFNFFVSAFFNMICILVKEFAKVEPCMTSSSIPKIHGTLTLHKIIETNGAK